jgi:predicted kinase
MTPLPLGAVVQGSWPLGLFPGAFREVQTCQPVISPKEEGLWRSDTTAPTGSIPNREVDLFKHREALVKAGYNPVRGPSQTHAQEDTASRTHEPLQLGRRTALMARSPKLYIAMVGLPAMGKSTVAAKIKENLEKDDIRVGIFNNGDVRRRLIPENTSQASFYDPDNAQAVALREHIAAVNFAEAKAFLSADGEIAILDATNVSANRRETLRRSLTNHPILFVECINDDPELLALSVARKTKLPEFAHLSEAEARQSFVRRIGYYRHIYESPRLGAQPRAPRHLNNRIITEHTAAILPYYGVSRGTAHVRLDQKPLSRAPRRKRI